jgi:glycerol-3-phosphate acyltransferase PlsY
LIVGTSAIASIPIMGILLVEILVGVMSSDIVKVLSLYLLVGFTLATINHYTDEYINQLPSPYNVYVGFTVTILVILACVLCWEKVLNRWRR